MLIQDTKKLLRRIFGVDYPMPPQARPKDDPGATGGPEGGSRDYMTSYEWMKSETEVAGDRQGKYEEYMEMDDEDGDLPSAILDSYRDDACQRDLRNKKMLWPEGENSELIKVIKRLFVGPLNLESEFPRVIREMMKMGDDFEQLLLEDKRGVLGWKHRIPDMIHRVEDDFDRLKGFAIGDEDANPSLPWDFCHFRLGSKNRGVKYGTSILEPSRRRWYELRMAEQAALLFRIKMAPDRDVYYIDCGTQSPDHQLRTIQRWRKQIKKKVLVDPSLVRFEVQYDPRNTDDDLFWPVTQNRNSRIERLSGSGKMADMEDLRYWLTRYLSSVSVPVGYFGLLEQGGNLNLNTSLASQDIRYARKVKAIQQAALEGLMRICFIHLAHLGIDPFLPVNKFDLVMTPVSFLDEFHRQELYNIRVDIANRLLDLGERGQFNQKPWFEFVLMEFARIPSDVLKAVMPVKMGEEEQTGSSMTGFESMEPRDKMLLQEVLGRNPALVARLNLFTRSVALENLGNTILESSEFSIHYNKDRLDEFDEIVKRCSGAA